MVDHCLHQRRLSSSGCSSLLVKRIFGVPCVTSDASRFIDSRCLLKKCVTIDVYGGGLSVDGSKRNCFSLSVNT